MLSAASTWRRCDLPGVGIREQSASLIHLISKDPLYCREIDHPVRWPAAALLAPGVGVG
jgi:hypothetical protein